jgi:hypothetical protein
MFPSVPGRQATDVSTLIAKKMKKETAKHTPRNAILATALLIASFSAHAQDEAKQDAKNGTITVKDYFGKERTIFDGDGDGWDDLWCILHPDLKHRNKSIDTDGDKVTDYEEMILWRDPFVEGPIPRELTPEEIAEAERDAAAALVIAQEAWESKKAEAAPLLRQLLPPGQSDPDAKIVEAEDGSAALRRDAAASKLLTAGKERALDDLARKHRVERVYEDEDGKKLKLSGESLGPVFIQSNDTLSAAGISADELWPVQNNPALPNYFPWGFSESNTGLNLTGAGQTLGMWEVDGGVRASHIEMGATRIFQKDSAAIDTSGHATNVAGTMAARGVGSLYGSFYESRGVAYQANVFAYETKSSFKAERETAAAGNVTDPPLRLANHSWGATCGWRREDIDPTAGTNLQWVWYGPTAASFQEDHKFGFYMPDLDDDSGSTQVDSFLHSQAPQHLMIYACGNDRGQGPGVSPITYYYKTGISTWTPVSAASFPRDWDDGDAGFYDTVAPPGTSKNVLTVGAVEDVSYTSGGTFLGFGPGSNPALASFSGVGPTDDGRIKPDLVAVGTTNFGLRQTLGLTPTINGQPTAVLTAPNAAADSNYSLQAIGTSFAAPAVTGGQGLVQQRRAQLYPTLPAAQAWRGSTHKAIAINSCDDIEVEGPDYGRGYGMYNARRAVLAVDADHAAGRGSLIKEFSLAVGASASWVVTSNGTEPLSITVPWSDPPGPALTTITGPDAQNPMLVNNIDLKVEYLSTDTTTQPPPAPITVYFPWTLNPDLPTKSAVTRALAAVRAIDNRNNVEKVSIASPSPGRYRLTVTHSGGLSGNPAPSTQVVSAALSGVTPELPRITNLAQSPTATESILTFTADPGAYFTIQSSTDLETWADAGSVLAEEATNSVLVTSTTGETRRFWRMRRGQ